MSVGYVVLGRWAAVLVVLCGVVLDEKGVVSEKIVHSRLAHDGDMISIGIFWDGYLRGIAR